MTKKTIIVAILIAVIGILIGVGGTLLFQPVKVVERANTHAYDSLLKASNEVQRVSDSVIHAQYVIINKSDSNYKRLQKSRNYISNKYLTLYNEIHTTTIDSVLLIRDSLLSRYDRY